MNINIVRLNSSLVNDYLHFFDVTPHDNLKDDSKCYCVGFVSVDHRNDNTDFSTASKRREIAKDYVTNGKLDGYLAYNEFGEVIGWCNANTKNDCMFCGGFSYVLKDAFEVTTKKIKSIFCFVISPFWQHQGIATKLLERVIKDAKEEGYDFVESYPNDKFISVQYDFMGPISMYEKYGFAKGKNIGENKVIMKKEL